MSVTSDRATDLEDIRDLTHRYCLAADRFDLEGIMTLFAEDAVLDLTALAMPRLQGHAAIRDYYETSADSIAHRFHLAANHLTEIDGDDEARGTHHLYATAHLKDGQRIVLHGLHEDAYVRTGSGWKIAGRTLTMFVPPVLEGPDVA